MSTVPKLHYAKIRNGSKSKKSQHSTLREEEQGQDLFSHMNKDNLSYIQSQIKEKNKTKPHQRARSAFQQQQTVSVQMTQRQKNYQPIDQKESQLEETQRKQEYLQSQNIPQKQESKLSYYQVASNVNSGRVSSIEGSINSNSNNLMDKNSKFLNFLEGYIQQLHRAPQTIKPRILQLKTQQRQGQSQQQQWNSQINLYQQLKEQKKSNMILAKQMEKFKKAQLNNKQKIQMLEEQLESLVNIVSGIKTKIKERQYKQNTRRNFMEYHHNREDSQTSSLEKLEQEYHDFIRKGVPNLNIPYNVRTYRN